MSPDKFVKFVNEQRQTRNLSYAALARRIGMSRGHVRNVLIREKSLTAEVALRLGRALDIPPVEALSLAGFIDQN